MKAVPLSLKEANEFVAENHRHHPPVHRDKYRVGCEQDGELVGVVQVGRPVSRVMDDGETLEVVRLASNGEKNVCSFLYSRAARIAKELGYRRIITYILETESGDSLKASGWKLDKESAGGGSWSWSGRPRETDAPTCRKQRWAKELIQDGRDGTAGGSGGAGPERD